MQDLLRNLSKRSLSCLLTIYRFQHHSSNSPPSITMSHSRVLVTFNQLFIRTQLVSPPHHIYYWLIDISTVACQPNPANLVPFPNHFNTNAAGSRRTIPAYPRSSINCPYECDRFNPPFSPQTNMARRSGQKPSV